MPRRIRVLWPVEEDVRKLVHEGLYLCRFGHVLPHRHGLRTEVGEAVRAMNHALMRHPQHREPLRLHQPRDALPKPDRRFTFQEPRRRR